MQLKNKESNFKSRLFEQIYHIHMKYEIAKKKKRGKRMKNKNKIIHFFIF